MPSNGKKHLSHVGVSLGRTSRLPNKNSTASGHRQIRGYPGSTQNLPPVSPKAVMSSHSTGTSRRANAAAVVDFPDSLGPHTTTDVLKMETAHACSAATQ